MLLLINQQTNNKYQAKPGKFSAVAQLGIPRFGDQIPKNIPNI